MYFVTLIKFKVENWYPVFSRFLGKFKIIALENSDSPIYFVGNVTKVDICNTYSDNYRHSMSLKIRKTRGHKSFYVLHHCKTDENCTLVLCFCYAEEAKIHLTQTLNLRLFLCLLRNICNY